jgi:hypothetical protein
MSEIFTPSSDQTEEEKNKHILESFQDLTNHITPFSPSKTQAKVLFETNIMHKRHFYSNPKKVFQLTDKGALICRSRRTGKESFRVMLDCLTEAFDGADVLKGKVKKEQMLVIR